MKKVAVLAFLFAVISLSTIMYRSATRSAYVYGSDGAKEAVTENTGEYALITDDMMPEGHADALIIPLPEDAVSQEVQIASGRTGRELYVSIDSAQEEFYRNNAIHTDLDIFESAVCSEAESQDRLSLKFRLDGIYASDVVIRGSDHIEISFKTPSEQYRHIVIVDPAGGGSMAGARGSGLLEKDITLDTALLLKELADADESSDVRIYFTRLDDTNPDEAYRVFLADELEAGLYVQLCAAESDDAEQNGVFSQYNDRFYRRDLTNAEFAGILEKEIARHSGASALEIKGIEAEGDTLMRIKVPAAKVSLGYLTGNKDGVRLNDENYKRRLAAGVYEGIKAAIKELE